MPAGDANRTWFPELVDMLQSAWNEAMSMDQLIELTGQLATKLQTLRNERNIKPAMMWCPKCQTRHRAAPPQVSVRATILALRRFGIADDETVKVLEKRWKKHRDEHQLDLYGAPAGTPLPSHHVADRGLPRKP